jgi:hypothetical protein
MEFTSWKYLIPFKSYTYKRTGKYLSWFLTLPLKNG